MEQILIIEDDRDLNQGLCKALTGYQSLSEIRLI